jgi:Ni,Fe-hydrogenase maturation factor
VIFLFLNLVFFFIEFKFCHTHIYTYIWCIGVRAAIQKMIDKEISKPFGRQQMLVLQAIVASHADRGMCQAT